VGDTSTKIDTYFINEVLMLGDNATRMYVVREFVYIDNGRKYLEVGYTDCGNSTKDGVVDEFGNFIVGLIGEDGAWVTTPPEFDDDTTTTIVQPVVILNEFLWIYNDCTME
jgi:hypothetical protein